MRTLIEVAYLAAGLIVAVAMTASAAWAYPLGRVEFWWCGAAAIATTLVFGVGRVRRARARDKNEEHARG